jgi:PAS domain S-box-containing protein
LTTYNASGNNILSLNKDEQLLPHELLLINRTTENNIIEFSDIHKAEMSYFKGRILDISIPISIDTGDAIKVIASVFVRVDVDEAIYSIIEKWPYASKSAESLLVKRDGNDVLFLTKLRFKRTTGLNYRVSMAEENLPAALALNGFLGVLAGNDYRGVEVLASAHKVTGTDWALIAKVDAEEIYKPLYRVTNLIVFVTISFIALSFISFYLFWKSFTNRIKSRHLKVELDKQALERHFEYLSKFANDSIVLADNNWKIIEVNDKAIDTYQYSRDELIGKLVTELEAKDKKITDQELFKGSFHDGLVFEDNHRCKDGSVFPVEISLRTIKRKGELYRQLIIREIAERKRREEVLRISERIIDSTSDMIGLVDEEYRYVKVNKAFEAFLNKKSKDIIGHTVSQILGQNIFQEYVKPNAEKCLTGYEVVKYSRNIVIPGREPMDMDVYYTPYRDDNNNISGFIVNARDVTEIMMTEGKLYETNEKLLSVDEELRRSEKQLQTIIKAASLGTWELDLEENRHIVNDVWLEMLGLNRSDITEVSEDFDKLLHPDDIAYISNKFIEHVGSDETMTIEYRLRHKDGHYLWIEDRFAIVGRDADTLKPLRLSGVTKDISERKNIQMELQKTYNALKALSSCNEVLVRSTDEKCLTQDICNTITSMDYYSSAWVGYVINDDKNLIKLVAISGVEHAAIKKNQRINIKNTSIYDVIYSGEVLIEENIDQEKAEEFNIFNDDVINKFNSFIKLPLIIKNDVIGVIAIFTEHQHNFIKDEVNLLKEMASDMAYGINNLRMTDEKEIISKNLSSSLIQTIEAIAITVEKRDPYTSGHMNHVAQLSSLIAKEMGLSEQQIQGIELGAKIHDIGKIYIPSEILNRPGKLTQAEFEMIKSHSQVGYEIVKGIDFIWPVAEMILQHHEKLDGSGYPNGLKGDEIIIEAQILAVADILEAVSSHRPYRPALGVEKGLEIIKEARGVLLNSEAVDICVKLVEDGFVFTA